MQYIILGLANTVDEIKSIRHITRKRTLRSLKKLRCLLSPCPSKLVPDAIPYKA